MWELDTNPSQSPTTCTCVECIRFPVWIQQPQSSCCVIVLVSVGAGEYNSEHEKSGYTRSLKLHVSLGLETYQATSADSITHQWTILIPEFSLFLQLLLRITCKLWDRAWVGIVFQEENDLSCFKSTQRRNLHSRWRKSLHLTVLKLQPNRSISMTTQHAPPAAQWRLCDIIKSSGIVLFVLNSSYTAVWDQVDEECSCTNYHLLQELWL